MNKILILFAHPRFEQSRSNAALLGGLPEREGIYLHDLYEHYPDFNIDIEFEKKLLTENDIIVWHHPFYWYSAPPLLKQWIDMVLEFGWAYGPGGTALKGKIIFNVITSGGTREVYRPEGRNRFTVREFLVPFEQTAKHCHMEYLPPFAIMGTHRLSDETLRKYSMDFYELILRFLQGNFELRDIKNYDFLNDWISSLIVRHE